MSNYDVKINELKEKLETAKKKKIRAEARMEELQNQKNDIIKQLKEIGVSPEHLDEEIETLKNEMENLIKKVEAMLPADI
jgi:chromosome segregation ATPase